MDVSNEILLNAVKCQGYRVTVFTIFKLLRENQQRKGGGGGKLHHPSRLGLKKYSIWQSTNIECDKNKKQK